MKPLPKLDRTGDTPRLVPLPSSSPPTMDDAPRPRRRTRKRLLLLGAAITSALLLGGTLYWSQGLNPAAQAMESRLSIASVAFEPFQETIPVSAVLIPERTMFLDTVEGGRVIERHVEDGTFVEAGTPLISLRNKSLELDVMNREAQYTQQLSGLAQAQITFDQTLLRYDRDLMAAELQINLTRADLERRQPYQETGVPKSEIDRLQAELNHQERSYAMIKEAKARDTANASRNLDQLKQSVARMEASIGLVRDSLDELTLRAPLAGEVSGLSTEVGEVLRPGARVAQIDVRGNFKVRAQINEFYLGRVVGGQTATTQIGDTTYELAVQKIYPTVENREFAADLEFVATPPGNLRRGQTLQLRIALSEQADHLTLPLGAYLDETGGQFVYVLNADTGLATKRDVVLGRRGQGRVQVISGLSDGEQVITSTYSTFNDRDRVRVRSQSDA